MSLRLPLYPKHPERICWGCEALCPADRLACGNGSVRTPHPVELFGPDFYDWIASENGDATDVDVDKRQE